MLLLSTIKSCGRSPVRHGLTGFHFFQDKFKVNSSEVTLMYNPYTHCDWTDWRAPAKLENVAMRLHFALEQADVISNAVDQLSRGWVGVVETVSKWAQRASVRSRRSSRKLVCCSINLDLCVRWLEDIANTDLTKASKDGPHHTASQASTRQQMISKCLRHVKHSRDWLEPQVETAPASSKELHLVADSLHRTLCMLEEATREQDKLLDACHIKGNDSELALSEVLTMVEGCLGMCLVDLDTVLRWFALHQIYEVAMEPQWVEQLQSSLSPGAVEFDFKPSETAEASDQQQQLYNLQRRFPAVSVAAIKHVLESCEGHGGHAARALRKEGQHDIISQKVPMKESSKLISECVRGLWADSDLQRADPETVDKLYAPKPFLVQALDAVGAVLKHATVDSSSTLAAELEPVSKLLKQLRLDLEGSHDRTFTHFYFEKEAPQHTPARRAVKDLAAELSKSFSKLDVPLHLITKWRGLTALESSHRPTKTTCDSIHEIRLLLDTVQIPAPWHPQPAQACSCCSAKAPNENETMTDFVRDCIDKLAHIKSEKPNDPKKSQLVFNLAARNRPFEVIHAMALELLKMSKLCQQLAHRLKPEDSTGKIIRTDEQTKNIVFSEESKLRREAYYVAHRTLKQCSSMLESAASEIGGVNFSSNEILYWCSRKMMKSTAGAERGVAVFLETLGREEAVTPTGKQLRNAKRTAAVLNRRASALIHQFQFVTLGSLGTFRSEKAKLQYIKTHTRIEDQSSETDQIDQSQEEISELNILGMKMT